MQDYKVQEEIEYESNFRIACEYIGITTGILGIIYIVFFAHGGSL